MKRFEHGGNIHRFKSSKNFDEKSGPILDFSANINCLGPSQRVKKAFEESFKHMGAYPDPHYTRFIEVMAQKWSLSPEHIFPGNGAAELLHMVVAAFCPKTALVVGPTFVEYERALEAYGCETQFFMTADEEAFDLNLKAFMSAIECQKPELVILCNPNNPTGRLIERTELMPLLDLCCRLNITIILDEAFMDFAAERATVMGEVAKHHNLVVLRSLTKFYAIPAIRAGFAVTASQKLAAHYDKKAIPWSMNQVAQEVAVAAVTEEAFEKDTLSYYGLESGRFAKELAKLPLLRVFAPEANYIFFRYDGTLNLETCMAEVGILIRSCRNYRGLDQRYYRVAVKAKCDNEMLLSQLGEILKNDNH